MPTESVSFDQTARRTVARDEALRRYTQHLSAVQLKNSRWSAMLSRGRSALRHHLLPAPGAPLKSVPHAR